jgi:hypothetical protein
MSEEFVNKVAESGIITLDLEKYFPEEEIILFDIKDYLFMGLILKEKDFRQALKELDDEKYQHKIIAVTCTADAIVPMWAYMLISSTLQKASKEIVFGNESDAKTKLLLRNIHQINKEDFIDKRVVVKGCGETPIPEEAYLEITNLLIPVVKSIMFGEPCSTVPIYKKKN